MVYSVGKRTKVPAACFICDGIDVAPVEYNGSNRNEPRRHGHICIGWKLALDKNELRVCDRVIGRFCRIDGAAVDSEVKRIA